MAMRRQGGVEWDRSDGVTSGFLCDNEREDGLGGVGAKARENTSHAMYE